MNIKYTTSFRCHIKCGFFLWLMHIFKFVLENIHVYISMKTAYNANCFINTFNGRDARYRNMLMISYHNLRSSIFIIKLRIVISHNLLKITFIDYCLLKSLEGKINSKNVHILLKIRNSLFLIKKWLSLRYVVICIRGYTINLPNTKYKFMLAKYKGKISNKVNYFSIKIPAKNQLPIIFYTINITSLKSCMIILCFTIFLACFNLKCLSFNIQLIIKNTKNNSYTYDKFKILLNKTYESNLASLLNFRIHLFSVNNKIIIKNVSSKMSVFNLVELCPALYHCIGLLHKYD